MKFKFKAKMKVYAIQIQSKNGIMMNGRYECNELDYWNSYKYDYMQNPSRCCCECNKAFKIGK